MKKVEPKDMIHGRKYYFTNKDNSFAGYIVAGYIVFDDLISGGMHYQLYGDTKMGYFVTNELLCLSFYEIPIDMHIKLGTWRDRAMLFSYRDAANKTVVGIELKDGDNWNSLYSDEITFAGDEPEVFEYKGKKYLAEDVDKRFSELKPIN